MRQKLTKQEIRTLESIQARLTKMADKMEDNDCELHYGNGTCETQLNCAIAAIETILQEHFDD